MKVPIEKRQLAINYAKSLVADQTRPVAKPYDRLWQVARKLNVRRIESGATRSQGFLKQIDNGSYAIHYCQRSTVARRRYTVAHELAHLVLERFVPHINANSTVARGGMRDTQIERTVDRVAAELLMPEQLVIEELRQVCALQKEKNARINKLTACRAVRHQFGVSESAMVFRLLELPQLLSIIVRLVDKNAPGQLRGRRRVVQTSCDAQIAVIDVAKVVAPTAPKLAQLYKYDINVDTVWGNRTLQCCGWLRRLPYGDKSYHEFWILGWTWNETVNPAYDDSD